MIRKSQVKNTEMIKVHKRREIKGNNKMMNRLNKKIVTFPY